MNKNMKKKFHKGKHVTEEIFGKAKKLLEMGLKKTQIAEIMGYSWNMIHHISKMADFKAFEENKKIQKKLWQEKHGVKIETVTKESNPSLPETPIYDTLKEILVEMRTLNKLVAQAGKSKKFRLF